MKNFAVSFLLLFACVAVFPEESPTLSIQDIVGTYRLERIENPWMSDEVRERVNSRINRMYTTMEIGEDYFITADIRSMEQVTFEVVEKGGALQLDIIETYTYGLSEGSFLFPEYSPRLFDSIFVARPYLFVIEVLDYNTLVTYLEGSYLLYRRVE